MLFRKACAFLERDFLEAFSYKSQVLLDFASVFAKCFVLFFISKSFSIKGLEAYGGDYFQYAILGVALTGYQTAALESFSKAVYREQGAGTLEMILISPTSLRAVLFFNFAWSSFFAVMRFALYMTAGTLFFGLKFSAAGLAAACVTLALTLAALAGLGMISAAFILVYKRTDPLGYLLSGLSQLFSGVYFPVSILPPALQGISSFLPLTYSLEALRRALLKGEDLAALLSYWTPLALFSVILIPAGWVCFEWAVRKSQKDGSLHCW